MRTLAKYIITRAISVAMAVLAIGVMASQARAADDPRLPKSGTMMAAFTLPEVNGQQVSTMAYAGKPIVINFWAFWCDTWKAELPYLKSLSAEQKELGFTLVAVSVDGTRVPEFDKVTGGSVPFPVLLDLGGKVSAQYNAWHVPTVIILDRSGKVVYAHTGYPGNDLILSRLRWLANQDRGMEESAR